MIWVNPENVLGRNLARFYKGGIGGYEMPPPIPLVLKWRAYPDRADGVVVVSGTSDWTYGGYITVIPAGIISRPYSLRCIIIEKSSKGITYQMELTHGPLRDNITKFRFVGGDSVYDHKNLDRSAIPSTHELSARLAASTIKAGKPEEIVISICYIV